MEKMRPFLLFLLFFTGCATPPSAHQEAAYAPAFLLPSVIPEDGGIPAPPAAGSQADQRDFEGILKAQRSRTSEDCKRAASEEKTNLATFYGPPYGPLTEGEVEKLKPFFDRVQKDSKFFTGRAKEAWKRPRPYDANQEVKPCIALATSTAYPSGHATAATLFGKVLENLYPGRRNALRKRAEELAWNRVIGGVLHPSDVVIGKKFGERIYGELMKEPSFIEALEAEKRKL